MNTVETYSFINNAVSISWVEPAESDEHLHRTTIIQHYEFRRFIICVSQSGKLSLFRAKLKDNVPVKSSASHLGKWNLDSIERGYNHQAWTETNQFIIYK